MLYSKTSGLAVHSYAEVKIQKQTAFCITGHREHSVIPYKNDPANREITIEAIKLMLGRYIDAVMNKGYTTMINGLAEGADLWAAYHCLKRKRHTRKSTLISVMPFLRHAERFSREYIRLLNTVERYSDLLLTTHTDPDITYGKQAAPGFSPDLYRSRNYFLVDNSSVVVAFYNEKNFASGTAQTVRYAKNCGVPILSFGPDDVYRILDETGTDIHRIREKIAKLRITVPARADS